MIDNKLMDCCNECDSLHAVSCSFCRCVDGKNQIGKIVTCSHMPVCYKVKEEEKNNAIKPGDKVTLTGTVKHTLVGGFASVAVDAGDRKEYVTVPHDFIEKVKEGE